ncbi:MAG: type 4a pilus biogenesis protein PilO [Actinomycetota bacterium]|nr:type 4a pilus biogenesis protein PilO [Actinomycetota bacterium]
MNRRAPLFAGIAAGVIALLTLVVLLLPKISQVHKRQAELTQAQQQQQTLQAQVGQLQQARREAKQVKAQLEQLQTEIPPTADLPSMIRLLQGAASAAAVDFMSVSPGQPVAPTTGSGVSTIPTAIQVSGSFFSVEEFLFRLEQLPRAVKVVQIAISSSGGATSSTPTGTTTPQELALSITAEVYTTDASAGPGSIPGPTAGVSTGIVPAPVPSTSPGASPSPTSAAPTGA